MEFDRLIKCREYQYLARMDSLMIFNSAGRRVAEWFTNVPLDEKGQPYNWTYYCLVNTLPEDVRIAAKTEIELPWKELVDARLKECANGR